MKKNGLRWLSAFICALALVSVGCDNGSSGGGDDAPNYDVPGSGSLPAVAESTVIRNTVVNLNGSEDTYYEYLEFTSGTGGNYSVYKKGETENTKITVSPVDDTTALPTTFTYDAASGKITAGSYYAYMFNATKSGAETACLAKDILSTAGENKSSLINTWTSDLAGECTFNKNGTARLEKNGRFNSGDFTNDNGWITVGEIPFYFGKIGENTVLYYLAYATERSTVEAVGRSALQSHVLEFTSSGFLLLQ